MKLENDNSRTFQQRVNLGDMATVIINKSVHEGKITLISLNGINIAMPCGHRFFKWKNVLSVQKNTIKICTKNMKSIERN